MMRKLPKQLLIGLRLTVFIAALALVYTFVITGHLAGRVQQQCQRQPGHRQRQGRRLNADRSELPAGDVRQRTGA